MKDKVIEIKIRTAHKKDKNIIMALKHLRLAHKYFKKARWMGMSMVVKNIVDSFSQPMLPWQRFITLGGVYDKKMGKK